MAELIKAQEPFKFCTRLHLSELTGLRATNLIQLFDLINKVPDSCIYHHTHSFLQQHQYLNPEPSNDFAYWVREILGEKKLGEELADIDTVKYASIDSLRRKILGTIGGFLKNNPFAFFCFAREGEEFHFIKSVSFVAPTGYIAWNLREFADLLNEITIDSVYFHVFEARLRLGKKTNDFSNWIGNSIRDNELADKVSSLNPYKYALEDLRKLIVKMVWDKVS